jgi:hypothetical protein
VLGEDPSEVGEGLPGLGLHTALDQASSVDADLARDEQQVARSDAG